MFFNIKYLAMLFGAARGTERTPFTFKHHIWLLLGLFVIFLPFIDHNARNEKRLWRSRSRFRSF